MLGTRVLVTLVGLPILIAIFFLGGYPFVLLTAALLALAAIEFGGLYEHNGMRPIKWLMAAGSVALLLARFFAIDAEWLLPKLVLLAAIFHLIAYERGRDEAATDMSVTLSGIFYIGVLGSYFAGVRNLPNGEWWLLLTLVAVWLADSAAYLIGTPLGKHKMVPRLSPKKSWEGYIAGVVFAAGGVPLLGLLFTRLGMPTGASFTSANLALLGFAIGALTTLGDLTESMIKRQMKVKDAGQLLPGHGGIFDRIDSWLWALPIGYFLISLVFLK
jgi:phosphatidate cytidylyltransferase